MYAVSRIGWLLAFLAARPLDRIRLTKAMFMLWYRHRRRLDDYFSFVPYLYGPFSSQLYVALNQALESGLVAQPPSADERYARYYLTPKGKRALTSVADLMPADLDGEVRALAEWASSTSVNELLRTVYRSAPEYASNSIVRDKVR